MNVSFLVLLEKLRNRRSSEQAQHYLRSGNLYVMPSHICNGESQGKKIMLSIEESTLIIDGFSSRY